MSSSANRNIIYYIYDMVSSANDKVSGFGFYVSFVTILQLIFWVVNF